MPVQGGVTGNRTVPTGMLTARLAPLVMLTSFAAAVELDEHVAGTVGAHVGIPSGLSISGAMIVGDIEGPGVYRARGAVLLGELGTGAGKFGIGYADITGNDRGPYFLDRWNDWYHGEYFIWPYYGWSIRAVAVSTWYQTPVTESGRRYLGVECEAIGSMGTQTSWGGLHGVNVTVGALKRTDDGNVGMDGRNDKDEDEWLMSVSLGIGF
jgi:hypothetical protein